MENFQIFHDLIATYSYTWDAKDIDGFVELFTKDAVVATYRGTEENPSSMTEGREELRKTFVKRLKMFEEWGIQTRHYMMNTIISQNNPEEYEAVSMALITWQRPDHGAPEPRPVQAGHYRTLFAKEDGVWKISRREPHLEGLFHPKKVY